MSTTVRAGPRLRPPTGLVAGRPELFFVGSAVFHYLGPSFAVLLFARVEPAGVAWLRIVFAAAVLGAWRRPWRTLTTLGRDTVLLVCALGLVLALMNACFYLAIARLPLGTVAAIEFLPVIVLAAAGARSVRNLAALGLAVAGVYALVDVRIAGETTAIAFAAANAVLFACYIVVAHRVARDRAMVPIDGLAAAMLAATLVATPIGFTSAAPALADPVAVVAGLGVAVTSSVIPYVFDQLAMARLTRSTYSLLTSLLPATATAVGVVVLAQVPRPLEVVGVGLVVAGIALHRERATAPSGDRRRRYSVPRED